MSVAAVCHRWPAVVRRAGHLPRTPAVHAGMPERRGAPSLAPRLCSCHGPCGQVCDSGTTDSHTQTQPRPCRATPCRVCCHAGWPAVVRRGVRPDTCHTLHNMFTLCIAVCHERAYQVVRAWGRCKLSDFCANSVAARIGAGGADGGTHIEAVAGRVDPSDAASTWAAPAAGTRDRVCVSRWQRVVDPGAAITCASSRCGTHYGDNYPPPCLVLCGVCGVGGDHTGLRCVPRSLVREHYVTPV